MGGREKGEKSCITEGSSRMKGMDVLDWEDSQDVDRVQRGSPNTNYGLQESTTPALVHSLHQVHGTDAKM